MFDKRAFLIILIIIIIGSITSVSASDLNQTAAIADESAADDVDSVISQGTDSEVANITQKTFTDLNADIYGTSDVDVYLDCDYIYDPDRDSGFRDGVEVGCSVNVWGNGHTIDARNSARIFLVSDGDVVFHDLVFINGKTIDNGGAVSGKATCVNCTFINNTAKIGGGAVSDAYCINCSFTNNTGGYGGATTGSSCVNCTFTENHANYRGGAAVSTYHGSIVNCTFVRNTAYYHGGAIFYGSNTETYITNCTFIENYANVGGAIYLVFDDAVVVNCNFTRNSALWQGGAVRSVVCSNCSFTENHADYGGAMYQGSATNCNFTENYAIFGGATYGSSSVDSTFTGNYADYGGAVYDGFRTLRCRFIGNYAVLGGAIYTATLAVEECRFISNFARNGGATYQTSVKNSYFAYNEAADNGGAVYGESAVNCTFKNNTANVSGNDTYNTIVPNSSDCNIIYFDASAPFDGDGSKTSPYKYLLAERIGYGVTAYFKEGTYDLKSTCIVKGAKLIGETSNVVINCLVEDQYDFIVRDNGCLELKNLQIHNANILNQATLIAEDVSFDGNDVLSNSTEIPNGSGVFDASYGGVIICDTPGNVKSTLYLEGCYFMTLYDAFNGGAIAAINSDIYISRTSFMHYSSAYKGGAIYCVNSNLNVHNVQFNPFTLSGDEDSTVDRYDAYTSYYGGSIYCENSDVYMRQSTFNSSVSFSFGGCIASMNSHITVDECNFNTSMSLVDGGGAIYNSKSELHIFDSQFLGNSAEFGGAICNVNSLLDSYHATYRENHANSYGGAIYDIYGTLDLYQNWFYVSHAKVGGSIYTRIPDSFVLYSNTFGDSFAEEGSSIFFDGKKESIGSEYMDYLNSEGLVLYNHFANDYHLFAVFTATLNGEQYYLVSNPLVYQMASSKPSILYLPYPIFEVSDGQASIVLYDSTDGTNLTSIVTKNDVHDVCAKIGFSEEFINPVVNFYLMEDININAYFKRQSGTNVFTGSLEDLFKGYNVAKTFSIDLSEKAADGNYNVTVSIPLDFEKSILSIKSDNLYEANTNSSISMVDGSSDSSAGALPSYYNSRDYGLVSPVKDQGNGGNCWAFAGLATLETCLKKATGISYDFSEENAKNLMAAYSVYGIKIETNFAGYDSMIMSYLTSWLGPIDESSEVYDDYSSISVLQNPMFHIQNIRFLPVRMDSTDNDLYKLAIMDNGAVSVMFKWGKDYHAVSLVGWDDSYTGKDSLGNDANGAWIFKNSFGADWGDEGFGYLAYTQKLSEQIDPGMHAYTFVFNDVTPYDKIYQYDFAGVSQFYHYMDSIHFKNVFTAEDDSLLSAFSTYFDAVTNYTVSVYVNDELVLSQNGTASSGYYTIPFNTFVQLNKGDSFAIAIHNHNTEGYSCIPLCYAEEITKKTFSENVSFVSLDGVTWYDLYDYADSCHVACIKAFTQKINLKPVKISVNEFDTISTRNFNVKVTVDNFESINTINYCLLRFVVDGRTYYAQIRDGIATLNLNLDDGPHNISAQYIDNMFKSNIVELTFTVDASREVYNYNAIQDMVYSASDKSTIVLAHDYAYDECFDDGEYGVYIDRPITVDGRGHTINGLSKATGFYVASGNVVLKNIVFENMSSVNGGGIYVAGRNATLINCTFINSTATQYGGGIYSLFDITLKDCSFINDSANAGGGLYFISSASSIIENSCFESNLADVQGSAIYMAGAGAVSVSSTDFTDNMASYNGGAIFSAVNSNTFSDCSFTNNSAKAGGAMFSNANTNEFIGCVFANNSALESGGAITSHNDIEVRDCTFTNNSVTSKHPYDYGLMGGYGGGAISSYDNLTIYGSSFIGNFAFTSGGALYTNKYLNVYESEFTNNSANRGGGAVYNTLWQMFRSNMGITKFTETHYYDSIFMGNRANDGGAIYSSDVVENCTFIDNHASEVGGAINGAKVVNASRFISNFAQYAGAVYYGGVVPFYSYDSVFTDNHADITGGAIYCHKYEYDLTGRFASESYIHNGTFTNNSAGNTGGAILAYGFMSIDVSGFINNSATWGGAILAYEDIIVSSSSFTSNLAQDSGAGIYSDCSCVIVNSTFADNSAYDAAAIYSESQGSVEDSTFVNNHVDYAGGAIYSTGEFALSNSIFANNSAQYGGAVDIGISDKNSNSSINVSSCRFKNNKAERSAGALYIDGVGLIDDSSFTENSANWGGALYLVANGDYHIRNSSFINNSAVWGGTLISISDSEDVIARVNVSSSLFENNSAEKSGGAIYCDGYCAIYNSTFVENIASWGTAIFSRGYLDLMNSTVNSTQKAEAIYFYYHYYENKEYYGDLNMEGNEFDVESAAVFYAEDEVAYKYPLKVIFSNVTAVKDQYVLVCHLEDAQGNLLVGFGDLNLTLTDQNGNVINLRLGYDNELGGYGLNTSLIDYASYRMTGKIAGSHPNYYDVDDGSIIVGDGSSRDYPVLVSSGLTKVYGNTKKLTVTLKDSNGNPIANQYVSIKLNGKTSKLKTNSKGQVTLAVNLAPKTYYANISFEGNDKYYPATKTVKVLIKKANPRILAYKKTFNVNVKTKKYTVTLKDNKGKAIKYASLKIKVNGKTYYAKTNAKGQATFSLNKLVKKGTFKSTITYSGSKYYNKLTKKVTVSVR